MKTQIPAIKQNEQDGGLSSHSLIGSTAGWGEMFCDWCEHFIEEDETPVCTTNRENKKIWICENCVRDLASIIS